MCPRFITAVGLLLLGCGSSTRDESDSGSDSGVQAVDMDGGTESLVVLGTGTQLFEPLVDGQMVPVIAGPQGGYHIWASARLRAPMNPMQVKLTAKVKFNGMELSSTDYKVNAVRNGSYFEWYAMTALVPEPAAVRGQPTVVELIATDSAGRVARDTRRLTPYGP